MKKAFMCSLCHKGIIGGALYLDDASLTYKTQKLTVDRLYRNLVLPLRDIQSLTWRQIIFPIAAIRMTDGREYQFIIFNKRRFVQCYQDVRS